VLEAFFGMDPTSFRMRYLVGIVLAAVVTAAALRHIIHVYAGISREEIRTLALIAAGIGILLAIVLFRRRKRHP
jgi:LPXTG-motif cell wall-anchored protein